MHSTRRCRRRANRSERREVAARSEPRLEADSELLATVVLELLDVSNHSAGVELLLFAGQREPVWVSVATMAYESRLTRALAYFGGTRPTACGATGSRTRRRDAARRTRSLSDPTRSRT